MTYLPESIAHSVISEAVRELLARGVEADMIRDALERQRMVLGAKSTERAE